MNKKETRLFVEVLPYLKVVPSMQIKEAREGERAPNFGAISRFTPEMKGKKANKRKYLAYFIYMEIPKSSRLGNILYANIRVQY